MRRQESTGLPGAHACEHKVTNPFVGYQVDAHVLADLPAQRAHETAEPLRVYRPAHSAAFSKLTSGRTRAL